MKSNCTGCSKTRKQSDMRKVDTGIVLCRFCIAKLKRKRRYED